MGQMSKKRRRNKGKFKYNAKINKKNIAMKNKLENPVNSEAIRQNWNKKLSTSENFKNIGLVYNLNRAMKPRQRYLEVTEEMTMEEIENYNENKSKLVSKIEQQSRKLNEQANAKMSKGAVNYITSLLDKYGEDYKAMAQDPTNHDQETWKQLRTKVRKFKNCTVQYAQYLKKRGILNS